MISKSFQKIPLKNDLDIDLALADQLFEKLSDEYCAVISESFQADEPYPYALNYQSYKYVKLQKESSIESVILSYQELNNRLSRFISVHITMIIHSLELTDMSFYVNQSVTHLYQIYESQHDGCCPGLYLL